jgi:hypothetical protein
MNDIFTMARFAKLGVFFLRNLQESKRAETEPLLKTILKQKLSLSNTTQWMYNEDQSKRDFEDDRHEITNIAKLLKNLRQAKSLLPPILDLKPVQQFFRLNFSKCLVSMD